MYEITITNGAETELLHDILPNSFRKVMSGSFTDVAASICRPTAQFTIAPQNPTYNKIKEMQTIVKIRNTLTDEIEFEGRTIQNPRDSLDSSGTICKEYIAEGLISWLMDSRQEYSKETRTPSGFISYVLSAHNLRYPDKTILPGICDAYGYLECTTNYRTTLEELNVNLIKRIGGEISLRRDENGDLRLDYLLDGIGQRKSTIVRLGRNLQSLNYSKDPTSIVNRLIPLGKKQSDGSRLTLKGYYQDDPNRFWIDDTISATQYTIIEGTVTFDSVETQQELDQKGRESLSSMTKPKYGYTAEVLDLSVIGEEHDPLKAGNTYRFICQSNGIDAFLRLVKRTVDILKPYMPTVEIGEKPVRLSYSESKVDTAAIKAVNDKVDTNITETNNLEKRVADIERRLNGLSFWKGTQAGYNLIEEKDPSTIYFAW